MSPEPPEASREPEPLEFLISGLDTAFAAKLAIRLVRENGSDMLGIVADAWLYGATACRNALRNRRVCHVCGCWEQHACLNEQNEPCSWVGPNLCSACQPPPEATPTEKAAA